MDCIPRFVLASLFGLAMACAGGTSGGDVDLGSLLSGLSGRDTASGLDEGTVVSGLKEALRVGTERSVARTSRMDGFLADELIRIHTPESLRTMTQALRTVGFGARVDELEVAMNRAAERASGEAREVFWAGIRQMSVADAWGILNGGETAATDYFRATTQDALRARFAPIVEAQMQAVGLVRLYDDLVARYRALPLTGLTAQPPDLRQHVTQGALDGLFLVLGQEEARIRQDPAARTSELLRRVFAGARGG